MAKVKFNMAGAINIVSRSAKDGIVDIMQEVEQMAVNDAPLDTGELRESAELVINDKSVVVRFTAPHAAVQHENLEFNHPVGKAKFLEDAYNTIVPGARPKLARKIANDLNNKN